MTKEQFIDIMNELLEIFKDEEELRTAFQKFDPDFNDISFSRYSNLLLKTLTIAMGDTSDWISYWLYELDWGKLYKKGCVKDKGKDIKLKTLGDLYNIIKVK